MVAREHHGHAVVPNHLVERVEKKAEPAVDMQQLIVDLPGVGPERVADGVSGRE